MNEPLYMQKKYRSTNEPKMHPLVRKGFVFVPSAGMRLAPEVLILELMREIFYSSHHGGSSGTKELKPDAKDDNSSFLFTPGERAVLHAMRGRRKKSRLSDTKEFFAPAYPSLARLGWIGKNRERVVRNFLLSGPIAQYLWGEGADSENGKTAQRDLAITVMEALVGNQSCVDGQLKNRELLAATIGPEGFDADRELPKSNFIEKTGYSPVMMETPNDELAVRVTNDFLAVCQIEGDIPRMQWLQLLMTFLRFSLPMWLLAQMQITKHLHSWLLKAADSGCIVDRKEAEKEIANRNRGLLHPTLTPTRELLEHIENYMKCRVELNIFLYCLEQVRPDHVEGKRITYTAHGQEALAFEDLLVLARDASSDIKSLERYKAVAGDEVVRTFLTREGEQFSAWRNPLMRGQGKNIDEFFRVLYRAEVGDEGGGYLLEPGGRGAKRGFQVFPGQLLLKTIAYLSAQRKWSNDALRGAGKLVLHDLEEHFGQYGVDFSTAADARPLLMEELQTMGLLTGSWDAGSSVAVSCPY